MDRLNLGEFCQECLCAECSQFKPIPLEKSGEQNG